MSDPLRVGGLISGIDVNGLIQEMVKARQGPLDDLKREKDYVTLQKSTLQDVNKLILDLRSSLFNLRLQSIMKSKTASSSNSNVITATANVEASLGNHTITVSQLATPARATSLYTRSRLVDAGDTGISSISGRPTDNIEAEHTLTISNDGGTLWAVDKADVKNVSTLHLLQGSATQSGGGSASVESSTTEGTIGTTISSGSAITVNYGDDTVTIYTSKDYTADTTTMAEVAADLEDQINEALNSLKGTTDVTYVAVRVDPSPGTGNDSLRIYDATGSVSSLSVDSGSAANALGLSNGTESSSNYIESKVYSTTGYADLLSAMNATYGLVRGVTFSSSALADGELQWISDASLNVGKATYSKVIGGSGVSSGSGLNVTATGLDNANFATPPSSSTNGTFTINGVEITINDYTKLSVNDVLGMINSSGAGVTATYDSTNDRFVLTANEPGATKISLGSTSDTSNFLTIAKLTVVSGATKTTGTEEGSIDPTTPLAETGMTVTPSSGTFTINGVSIYVDTTTDSMNDLIEKINNSGAGVIASYDSVADKVTITADPSSSKVASNADKITFGSTSDTSNILYALNIVDTTGVEKEEGSTGTDAKFTVDGASYVRTSNTIDDVIGGVTFTLQGVSSSNVTLSITADTDTSLDAIATFVAEYNKVIEKLNPPELTDFEKQYLQPLTDEDKQGMTDSQIDDYEEKYKLYTGYEIIRNTPELDSFLNALRTETFQPVEGSNTYSSIADIGITTDYFGTFESELQGYLITKSTDKDEIKEILSGNTTLMNALRFHPDDVYELFAKNGDTTEEKGVARRLADLANDYFGVGGSIYSKIKTRGYYDQQLAELNKQIIEETNDLSEYENYLWDKFSAMEQAIARMKYQSDYLTTQLAAWSKK